MTQDNKIFKFLVEFIKDEINKPDFKQKCIKPLLLYILFYIIPFLLIFLLLNFITTLFAVFLVFYIKINKK